MENDHSKLKIQIPNLGWKQFLTARDEMLAAYDRARIHSEKRIVQTGHGNIAEAEFRKWLSNFLPKRYAVSSGYIISQGLPHSDSLIHYDVIIYDQVESPVLWVDDSSDLSGQGRSLAIPVEYVCGVIEVKSAFNKKAAKNAVEQLAKLKPLMTNIDNDHLPVKMYLPKNFFCATIFFELRKNDMMDFAAIDQLAEASELRGFYGGYILKGETLENYFSGKLALIKEKDDFPDYNTSLLFWAKSKGKKVGINEYLKIFLHFSESHFSEFAFDIISLLKGNYHPNVLSSLYGYGSTQFEKGSRSEIRYSNPEDAKRYDAEINKFLNNDSAE